MKNNKKIKHFTGKKLIAIAACVGTILAAGVVANAATNGAVIGSILKITDNLGITHVYTLDSIDDESVLYSYEDETGCGIIAIADADNSGKTDNEKVSDAEEYIKSDEYKQSLENQQIMDEYSEKGEGTYHGKNSKGEAFTIIVDKDGGCEMTYDNADSNSEYLIQRIESTDDETASESNEE